MLALRYVAGFDATEIGRAMGMSASVSDPAVAPVDRLRLEVADADRTCGSWSARSRRRRASRTPLDDAGIAAAEHPPLEHGSRCHRWRRSWWPRRSVSGSSAAPRSSPAAGRRCQPFGGRRNAGADGRAVVDAAGWDPRGLTSTLDRRRAARRGLDAERLTARLDISASGLVITERTGGAAVEALKTSITGDGSSLRLTSNSVASCSAENSYGRYRWSQSPGGTVLTITSAGDQRAPARPRSPAPGTGWAATPGAPTASATSTLEPTHRGTSSPPYPAPGGIRHRSHLRGSAGGTNSHDFGVGYWLERTRGMTALQAKGHADDWPPQRLLVMSIRRRVQDATHAGSQTRRWAGRPPISSPSSPITRPSTPQSRSRSRSAACRARWSTSS